MRTAATLTVALLLTACAGPTWVKPGAGAQEFHADQSACMGQSGMGTATVSLMQQHNQRVIYEGCMMGRGWAARR